jgi:hypothetical protein
MSSEPRRPGGHWYLDSRGYVRRFTTGLRLRAYSSSADVSVKHQPIRERSLWRAYRARSSPESVSRRNQTTGVANDFSNNVVLPHDPIIGPLLDGNGMARRESPSSA